MKTFLIFNKDVFDPVLARLVPADTGEAALDRYMGEVEAYDKVFREHVLDLSHNMTFLEQFYLSSGQEQERITVSGTTGTEEAIVRSRVKRFFAPAPAIGERFFRYMDSENPRDLDDAVFQFIALNDGGWRAGYRAVDLADIRSLDAPSAVGAGGD